MTFDLDTDLEALRREAREFADRALAPSAVAIDRADAIPEGMAAEIERLNVWSRGPLAATVAIEELAAVSGAAAALAALGPRADAGVATLSGLRGVAPVPEPSDEQRLGVAAVSLGIGRRALEEALSVGRAHGDRPAGDPDEPPHWALADAAADLDAARLMVRAAAAADSSGAAMAQVLAGSAAVRAVEAAIRIVGPDALQPGAALERCSRDATATRFIAGTEDDARRVAADRLLGRRGGRP
jgi:alkylation response protein AidB-like acyl-CoA dehydrogenase